MGRGRYGYKPLTAEKKENEPKMGQNGVKANEKSQLSFFIH